MSRKKEKYQPHQIKPKGSSAFVGGFFTRYPEALYAALVEMGDRKADFIREAVQEKLERESNTKQTK